MSQPTLPVAIPEWQQWAAEHPSQDDPNLIPITCDEPIICDLVTIARLTAGLISELHRARNNHPVASGVQRWCDLITDVSGRLPLRISMLWDQLGEDHPLRAGYQHDFTGRTHS